MTADEYFICSLLHPDGTS